MLSRHALLGMPEDRFRYSLRSRLRGRRGASIAKTAVRAARFAHRSSGRSSRVAMARRSAPAPSSRPGFGGERRLSRLYLAVRHPLGDEDRARGSAGAFRLTSSRHLASSHPRLVPSCPCASAFSSGAAVASLTCSSAPGRAGRPCRRGRPRRRARRPKQTKGAPASMRLGGETSSCRRLLPASEGEDAPRRPPLRLRGTAPGPRASAAIGSTLRGQEALPPPRLDRRGGASEASPLRPARHEVGAEAVDVHRVAVLWMLVEGKHSSVVMHRVPRAARSRPGGTTLQGGDRHDLEGDLHPLT